LVLEHEAKVEFTRNLAEKILSVTEFASEGFVIERSLRDNHVEFLMKEMRQETFHPEWVTLITCICDQKFGEHHAGTEYRMNGQHCSWALVQIPEKDYQCPDKVRMMRYRAKTVEDMRNLYASIDQNAPRTKAHVIVTELAGTEQVKGLPVTVVRILSEGYCLYKWDNQEERRKHHGKDVAFLMKTDNSILVTTVSAYLSTFSITSISWMKRASVVAGMFTTFAKAVRDSCEFWDSVREGVNFTSKNDPRCRLRDALMTCSITHNRAAKKMRGRGQIKIATAEEVLRWVINAWNAWREKKELVVLRVILDAKRPKVK
jgi:hypothetical protein